MYLSSGQRKRNLIAFAAPCKRLPKTAPSLCLGVEGHISRLFGFDSLNRHCLFFNVGDLTCVDKAKVVVMMSRLIDLLTVKFHPLVTYYVWWDSLRYVSVPVQMLCSLLCSQKLNYLSVNILQLTRVLFLRENLHRETTINVNGVPNLHLIL